MLDIFSDAYRTEALAFIDKTLDNVADLPPNLSWKNREVVALVADVRSLLVSGVLVPGGFTREPVCTCPSGDGSLRWPCPVHPPADSTDSDEAARVARVDAANRRTAERLARTHPQSSDRGSSDG